MTVDFSPTAADYVHRPPFPPRLYDRLREYGLDASPDQLVLDLGAGPGLFSRPLRCRVVSADPSPPLLLRNHGHRVVARAESLPFADESFDAVTAAQCWHWFDRRRAPSEIHRILKRNGLVAVVYQMPIPLPGSVAHATEQLILHVRPNWRHANSAGINGQALRDLQSHAFRDIESFSFDASHPFTRDAWIAAARTTSAVATLPPRQLASFTTALGNMLSSHDEIVMIPHRIFAAVANAWRGQTGT